MKRLLFFVCLAAFGCGSAIDQYKPGKIKDLPANAHLVHDTAWGTGTRTISAQYLGCGGVYLIKDGGGVLIDPFFSNQKLPGLARSVLNHKRIVGSDSNMVNEGWKRIQRHGGETPTILGMFAAHSHFDHLLDVPAVHARLSNPPKVYLNKSGYNTCYNVLGSQQMEVLEDHMSTAEEEKPPVVLLNTNGNKICVYPVWAQHNPHANHIKFFDGTVTEPIDYFDNPYAKTRANDWLEGNTFSFLIDYLDAQGNIDFRVFVQSSSCNPNAGFPPASLLSRKAVDLAFLGIASYEASPQYPDSLLTAIRPHNIAWIHWEDFFVKYTDPVRTVRATNVPAFFKNQSVLKYQNHSFTPYPGSILKITY